MKAVLVSHALCPYVQRAAIVLAEKRVPFERHDVDLADKPAWFLEVSPLGKTPVLLADGVPIFESAVICEYLDEVIAPRLHPLDPLDRARHRGWMEFGSQVLDGIAAYYNAPDEKALEARRSQLIARFARLDAELQTRDRGGPWFAGARFSIVDAVFAPVFRYFDAFERIGERGWFDATPALRAWRDALAARPSVRDAVDAQYPQRLLAFIEARGSELSRRAQLSRAATA